MSTAADVSRFMQAYAKQHAAGAFATPTAVELDRAGWDEWADGPHRTIVARHRLTRTSRRRDWTGRDYMLPAGALVASHVARTPDAPIPNLDRYDVVVGYVDDLELRAALDAARPRVATRISAASEVLGVWGSAGDRPHREHPVDVVTLARLTDGIRFSTALRRAALAELSVADQWADDFPFYSDGTWSAVSLRGYRRDDPSWGVKPSEMGRKWHDDHPGAADYRCEWTVLGDRMTTTRALVESVKWWGEFDRVRLMRVAARHDGKPARLGRHCDITDRQAGTAPGQMVRFFIPLTTDPEVTMSAWTLDGRRLDTHLEPWSTYYLDIRKPHAALNPSPVDRVHLTVDVIVTDEVRRHLEMIR